MKKQTLFSLIFIFVTFSIKAQFTISGQLKDTINDPIASATVMLLNVKDSTLAHFVISDAKGNFAFKNIKKTDYIFKISHFVYMPQMFLVQPTEEKELNLGVIFLKPIANFLMEVVIKEAKAPIFIKGDTVEYDASTFKVPPGSTVEDLLRRLPGIDVDAEGNISTMGKDVKTVYVDGKTFFGNNPKTVTQNLDAQAVSKVQVFTEKSEQEKITGIADGSQEKVMNLALKEEYKKGYFGKATAGYGWGQGAPHRWIARGNFNWFTEKQQLSFIGYGNNLNQSGSNWDDMQDFYGQNMQSGRDNGDFGFGSRGGGFNVQIRTSSYSDGSGFSNNGGGGVNYNYYHKKVKFNAGYFYTVNQSFSDVFANRQTFLQDSSFFRIDTTYNNNLRQNHSFSTRFEYEIDSCNNIIVRANVEYSPAKRKHEVAQLFQTPEFLDINRLSVNNKYKNDNLSFDVLAIYNHKFKKKRRSFAMSGFYNYKNGYNFEDIDNLNEFFHGTDSEKIKFVVKNNKTSEDHNVKSSLLYVEPLGKRFSIMGFYNFKNSLSLNNNFSTAPDNSNADIDSLWVNYKNNTLYNRVGTSVNYGHNGINLTLGGAYQSIMLTGTLETKPNITEKHKFSPYHSFIPYFSANLDLPKKVYVNASYSYDVSEPNISYLFPMPNLSNTMNIILGNPNLKPERYHFVRAGVNYWNNVSMLSVSFNASMNFFDYTIVYNQTTKYIENQGYVTVFEPSNVKGGDSYYANIWTSVPIVKTILTFSFSCNGSIRNSRVFINDIENNTNSKNYYVNSWFNITAGKKVNIYFGANVSQTFTKYSIQTDRNQSYINYSAFINAKWQVFKKTFLEGSYSFNNYSNKKLDFVRNIHRLNLSVRQVIGKKNQWELRLSAHDILNQNKSISQIAQTNYIEYRTSPTLARYFMLTAAYNIKGFETKNESNRRFY
jgi:hypothetical protein